MKHSLIKLFFYFFATILFSCNSNTLPDCNDPFVKMQLRSIIEEQLNKELIMYETSENEVKEAQFFTSIFSNNGVEFDFIRKTEINEKLNSCECSAQMSIQLEPTIIKFFNNLKLEEVNNLYGFNGMYLNSSELRSLLEFKNIDVQYSLQTMENGEVFIEASLPQGTFEAFQQYYLLNNAYQKEMAKNNFGV